MTDNSCRPGNDLHESTRNNCHQPKRNYHQHWKGRIINEPQQLISKYILNHGLWLNSLTQTLFLDNFSRCDQPIWDPKTLQHTMLNITISNSLSITKTVLDKNDRKLAGGITTSMNSAQIIGQFASISITFGNIGRFSKHDSYLGFSFIINDCSSFGIWISIANNEIR